MTSLVFTAALFLCVVAATWESSWSYPSNSAVNIRSKRSIDSENPEEVLRMLARLAQDVMDTESTLRTEKRGIDFGLSRGYSGNQAAKHLMGLAAANYANGPGRKRRDLDLQ